MPWLATTDDEVARFHPEFEQAANEALQLSDLKNDYEWRHHLRTPGVSVVPDYVLQRRETHRWVLSFEIKRTNEAVRSTRYQIQAKGYAETNQDKYDSQSPKYFAISNLETTVLCALNGTRPPNECRLQGGFYSSGMFATDDTNTHRNQFIADLRALVARVMSDEKPVFDVVWPAVLTTFRTFSAGLPNVPEIYIEEPATANWPIVRDYFGSSVQLDSARIFILRCLLAEYLRGVLLRYQHPGIGAVPAMQAEPDAVARTIAAIRDVDFESLFEAAALSQYRNLTNEVVRARLRDYVAQITSPQSRVVDLARDRVDHAQLVDDLTDTLLPVNSRDECGRVQTDPELASVLAYLTISEQGNVFDPCCGEGALLSAAYDRLRNLGSDNQSALRMICGIEADAISSRVAAMRLALKEPATVSPDPPIDIARADMFAGSTRFGTSGYILMNPPFKRYEAQDLRPVPEPLRDHYNNAITALDGRDPVTTAGQPNLFHYYVEYVGKAVDEGTTLGIVLDNRWYHSGYGEPLRAFLLDGFKILGVVEYPHSAFFENWSIATSLLIATKEEVVPDTHSVRFIRCTVDPRSTDLLKLSRAFYAGGEWPTDWRMREVPQRDLEAEVGWKRFFATELETDFRFADWPTLPSLFRRSRRGSLEKEGGGIAVFEFPFDRTQYGPRRVAMADGRRFQTGKSSPLTLDQNRELRELASNISEEFRGFGLKNSDEPSRYVLTEADVTHTQVIEPPSLRGRYKFYLRNVRSRWTAAHHAAVAEMRSNPAMGAYIGAIEEIVNLTANVLSIDQLWNVLKEPVAGELIVPRKMRTGHRVHVNYFALTPRGRQVRISSNFLTYSNCRAKDPSTGLTREHAVKLIAAFLVSSFGQLQFEIEGYNREGCLAIESEQLARIRVFDPRWVRPENRQAIVDAFEHLEYPIATDRLSAEQPARNNLDRLFAAEIAKRHPQLSTDKLLQSVHAALDEWLDARMP